MATDTTTDTPRPRRSLDRRSVAICACIALIAALAAALVASRVLGDDDDVASAGESGFTLTPTDIDPARLLAVELTTIEDEPTSLGGLIDEKPVLVNLWSQSCIPCIKEMPLLEQAAQANPQIDVLGIAVQDRLDRALAMAEQTGITYPWVQDPLGDFLAEAKAPAMPTTLLVTADGEVLDLRIGEFKSLTDIQSFIDRQLD